jgi:hypothetical protein
MADPQPPPRHRIFDVTSEPGSVSALRHSDRCLSDVRRYGFCEHEMLPRPKPPPPPPPPPPRWRERHPNWTELIGCTFFAVLILCYVIIFQVMGWWGWAVFTLSGVAWMGVLIWGIPKFLTTDFSKIIPPGTKL